VASSSCGNFVPQTGCNLGEIILWDVASGQPIGQPLLGHSNAINSVTFSQDGRTLVSGSADGSVILWDINLQTWQTLGCRIANRDLSPAEWELFFGDEPYQPTCP
jgi:WD40 repeat protein